MPALHDIVLDPGGAGPLWLLVLLALFTWVSEDLACLTAGALVAGGDVGFVPASAACVVGIGSSDAALFLAGRWVGRPLLGWWPFRHLAAAPAFERSRAWVAARGAHVIVLSRFAPGTRVATHLAAGVLGLRLAPCLGAIVFASSVWAPLLVAAGAAAAVKGGVDSIERSLPWLLGFGVAALGAWRGARALATHEGRRRLVGAWRRTVRWEFWPPWIFYLPVLVWIGWLMLRHRSVTVFTAANPGIPGGGFTGESKIAILRSLQAGGAPIAPFVGLPALTPPAVRALQARRFVARHGLPIVLKPDRGQRGTGVRILSSEHALHEAVVGLEEDAILQAYVPGVEFGLFYARRPCEARGRVISVTEKRRPFVWGDGRRTVRQLVFDDARAVAMARTYLVANAHRLSEVPAPGERVTLGDIGSHCRGAIFLDGRAHLTSALEEAVDRASRAFPGFAFGRYDVRAASAGALAAGEFTILELNGVTSEPTHIYDPAHGILFAWRTVARTWSLAFAIGREHAAGGARVWSLRELLAMARRTPSRESRETGRAARSSNPV